MKYCWKYLFLVELFFMKYVLISISPLTPLIVHKIQIPISCGSLPHYARCTSSDTIELNCAVTPLRGAFLLVVRIRSLQINCLV